MTGPRATADVLRVAAQTHPERDAYVHDDKRVTYAWLDRAADGFASTLIAHGVRPGSVVVLLMPSSIKLAACYLGALRAGAITSAVNLRLGEPEVASILLRTQPAVTVVGDGARVPAGAPTGMLIGLSDLRTAFAAAPGPHPDVASHAPACIVWTSGTTGAPKGAVYTHERMAAISDAMGALTAPGDRRLVVLPFPHVGYMTRMWDELAHGTTLVIGAEPWSASGTLALYDSQRITVGTGVPTQWALLLDHPTLGDVDFSSLRLAGIGGAAIAPSLVGRMRRALGCPVITRYTSTEAGITTGTAPDDADEVVAHTVGRPAAGVELTIVNPASGLVCPRGVAGEILVRGPAMMVGYWRDPDATAAAIDRDDRLHTGDLGVLDADGNLRIVGRLKDMYIRGGYNVYPVEVESVLDAHPAVTRAAVVGAPDPVLGEIGVAFVVVSPDTPAPSLDDVRAWCRARLADYKAPDRLLVVEDLPTTAMHKGDKQALAARAAAASPSPRTRPRARAGSVPEE